MKSRPTSVIAHRGVQNPWYENSLGAIGAALEAKADAVEIDVHATRDGVAVVHHDPVLPPRAGAARAGISELRHAELSAWTLPDGSPIPSLSEVLNLAAGRAHLHVEIKGRNIETQILECIAASKCSASVHSFDHRIVKRCAEVSPSIHRGILLESYLVDTIAALRNASAQDLWQYHELIDSDLIDEVHRAGSRIIAWTVNDPEDARRLAHAGVDGICTDNLRGVQLAVNAA